MEDKQTVAWPANAATDRFVEDGLFPWLGMSCSDDASDQHRPIILRRIGKQGGTGHPSEELRALLARTVQEEVVPRLLLAGRPATAGTGTSLTGDTTAGPEDVVALVALVITSDVNTALAFVESLRARGASLDHLYLELLAPTARRLGQLWLEDLCSFADVTVALSRLQRVVRELSPVFVVGGRPASHRRRAALVPMPGEQHTFGIFMVAEFFIRAGWDVWTEPPTTGADLSALVEREWFAVIGLSVSCSSGIERLPGLIHAIRRASCNREIGVMVGGRVFAEDPDLAMRVGADATALDGRQAALQAETLYALLASRAER
jgi:methanogenic corrinoid protein MtbC1